MNYELKFYESIGPPDFPTLPFLPIFRQLIYSQTVIANCWHRLKEIDCVMDAISPPVFHTPGQIGDVAVWPIWRV